MKKPKTPTLAKRLDALLVEFDKMYWNCNEFRKPYDSFPYPWNRYDSRIACPIIAEMIKRIEKIK